MHGAVSKAKALKDAIPDQRLAHSLVARGSLGGFAAVWPVAAAGSAGFNGAFQLRNVVCTRSAA